MKNLSLINLITIIILLWLVLIISNKIPHPIIIIFIIIFYSILTCLNISTWKINYIFSIITFLIIIRGLLVLFLYFSSLISNEKIPWNLRKISILNRLIYIRLLTYIFLNKNIFIHNFINSYKENISLININEYPLSNINNLYIYPYSNYLILTVLFLLICLFIIIKISSKNLKPLRKIN